MADPVKARALKHLVGLKDGFQKGAETYHLPGLYHVLVQLAYESRQTESGFDVHPKLHQLPPGTEPYGPEYFA